MRETERIQTLINILKYLIDQSKERILQTDRLKNASKHL